MAHQTESLMGIAYADMISGISGDMVAAALLDLGLPEKKLRAELKKIPRLRYRVDITKKATHGIQATRFHVTVPGRQPGRTWKEVRGLIGRSRLEPEVKERALKVFSRLAEVEAQIHGVSPEKTHFHELGATDSIIDIIAMAVGTLYLDIGSFRFSRIPLGRGVTASRHGPLPLPAPATLELLKGLPVEWIPLEGETVTPTGAAILSVLGSPSDETLRMRVDRIGYGAGTREFPDRPNVLRLLLCREEPAWQHDEMMVLAANIDDMNPELYDYVFHRLFAAGARDVFLSPVQMKKNRPGTLLQIIAEPWVAEKLAEIVFHETSTIGIRYYPVRRLLLKRSASHVKTKFGPVQVKIIEEPDGTKRATPEYEDLRRIAAVKKVPLKVLYDEVLRSFRR
jgi:uncharacterized protein (TIGR00299 family) protein